MVTLADRRHLMTTLTRPDRQAIYTLVAMIMIVAIGSGYAVRTFDAFVHMFFADHYHRGWFDLWEPRWYGGFSVTTYPPLAHQSVALLTPLLGYPRAFSVVMGLALLGIYTGVSTLSSRFVSDAKQKPVIFAWTLLICVLLPTSHRFAYVFGQLPTLYATAFAFWAMVALDVYYVSGRFPALVAFVALTGAVAGTHHISMVFVALGATFVSLRALADLPFKSTFLRAMIAATGAAIAVGLVVWPFLAFAAAEPQAEIPHPSRAPLWERPFDLDLVEQLFFLVVSLGLAARFFAEKRRDTGVMALAVALLVILSLGGTTPLPRILFRAQWRWLTYDKFHIWAAMFVALPLAHAFAASAKRALVITVVLLPMVMLQVSHKAAERYQPPFIDDVAPLAAVLNSPDASHYRHLTLGFGDQLCRLDIVGQSPNIDGDYHTARRDPILRESGIAALDSAKYYETGPEILKKILAGANERSLRWVFVYDDGYYGYLFESGFELKEVWSNGVTLFEKADVPPIVEVARHKESVAAKLSWGIMPLLCVAIALSMGALSLTVTRGRREGRPAPHS
jgi:hypothetical protein